MPDIPQPILSLPARNDLGFLRQVFAAWREGRVFAICRDGAALDGLDLEVEAAPPPDQEPEMGWGRFDHVPDLSDRPAQITFSSGTEGRPKAIVISHRNLADVVARLNEAMQVTSDIREYIGVPVTYSFGLGRARAVAAAKGAFFLPERFDPLQIRRMLDRDEINAISAVPSLWRLILADPDIIGQARHPRPLDRDRQPAHVRRGQAGHAQVVPECPHRAALRPDRSVPQHLSRCLRGARGSAGIGRAGLGQGRDPHHGRRGHRHQGAACRAWASGAGRADHAPDRP